ncbi:hypothetical protein D7X96_07460 [Corallococcus interemptor]|uniref:ATPase AAA-type core domain-containing protein n=1 Tax=Corallococcus interemptor TaxID=2316720 RepID=A0A3A8R8M1_9BACT|nr:AAA family ATPase [Corallococcus interemptor]RKH71754.1 hypothetical protein D7X96_07460 [Corallococcus interemptor]
MLTSLRIQNFRSLRNLKVEGLTRVSLLVGANNTGKTSVLEAAELVLAGHHPSAIAWSPMRRGETSSHAEEGLQGELVEVAHLFSRHATEKPGVFRIEAITPQEIFFEGRLKSGVGSTRVSAKTPVRGLSLRVDSPGAIELESDQFGPAVYDLAGRALSLDDLGLSIGSESYGNNRVGFIETTSPGAAFLRDLWDGVVLTPEEESVTEVLRIIEPDIERIAALSGSHHRRSDASMFVKLRDSEQRIPLGSMGEGIKRLMTLSLNLVHVAGGYLLVDEIDTGLHHSVMVKMWRLVTEAAKRLNVQVLATTHSLDCVRALASLYEEQQDLRDVISVHRIERNAEHNVPYSADELLIAAKHEMEIR